MKQNTFFKKASVIIGVLSIISLLFTVISCEDTSKDKKSTKITFKYTKPDSTEAAKQLAVVEKKDGGAKKDKVYYTVAAPDGKYVSSITASADSKAGISYKLKSHKIASGKVKIADATASEGKVEKGKVTFKDGVKGFFYLEATAKAKGDYKKATKRVLLLVGEIPVAPEYIVVDEFTLGSGSTKEQFKINKEKTEVLIDHDESSINDKTISFKLKMDYSMLPKEAPLSEATPTLSGNGIVNDATVSDSTITVSADKDNDTEAKIRGALVSPYATTPVDVVTLKPQP